jgi:hypothetical protein
MINWQKLPFRRHTSYNIIRAVYVGREVPDPTKESSMVAGPVATGPATSTKVSEIDVRLRHWYSHEVSRWER